MVGIRFRIAEDRPVNDRYAIYGMDESLRSASRLYRLHGRLQCHLHHSPLVTKPQFGRRFPIKNLRRIVNIDSQSYSTA